MKKYILSLVLIIILVFVGFKLLSKRTRLPEESTKETVTELLSQKFNRPTNLLIIQVQSDTGAFAKGTYNEAEVGGGVWFAAKTTQGWELASAGNGIVSCEEISSYNFPKDIIPSCIETQNGNKLIER